MWCKHIFNVSFHRTGTNSVHDLFLRSGLSSIHWPGIRRGVSGIDERIVIGHETDRTFVAAALAPVIATVTAVGDVPIPALYDELDHTYPNSAFILMFRSPFAWVDSVRRHTADRELNPFERVQYWRYLPSRPLSLRTVTDSQLYSVFLTHYSNVLSFFAERGTCLFVDLEDPDAGPTICRFLELPPTDLGHLDFRHGHGVRDRRGAPDS
jgi:hypothetical protein